MTWTWPKKFLNVLRLMKGIGIGMDIFSLLVYFAFISVWYPPLWWFGNQVFIFLLSRDDILKNKRCWILNLWWFAGFRKKKCLILTEEWEVYSVKKVNRKETLRIISLKWIRRSHRPQLKSKCPNQISQYVQNRTVLNCIKPFLN